VTRNNSRVAELLLSVLAALLAFLGVRRMRRGRNPARAVIVSPPRSTVIAKDGTVRSVQAAELTLDGGQLDRLWTPENLENLARTYWRFLSRVTLGTVRVIYGQDERSVVLLGRPFTLLRFEPPEYQLDGLANATTLSTLALAEWATIEEDMAEVIDAQKALSVGLVNEVVPRDDLEARVEAIARHISQAPLTTLLATKANLKRAWELMGMRVHWQSSNDLVALASISKDVQQLIQQVFKDKVLPSEHARRQAAAASDGAAT